MLNVKNILKALTEFYWWKFPREGFLTSPSPLPHQIRGNKKCTVMGATKAKDGQDVSV